MDLAIAAYINRVDGCPCGDAKISLFKGAESQEWQAKRRKLLIFLKGSKKQKQLLQLEDSDMYSYFESIWNIRNSHMIQGLPSQYIFSFTAAIKRTAFIPCVKLVSQQVRYAGIQEVLLSPIYRFLYLMRIVLGEVSHARHANLFMLDILSHRNHWM